ncbi:MAG: hypothetical protein R3F50_06310 [Gammaproteobacteria bacterium]|jgi:uncharacterized protein YjbJ (UPF0337 family)
MRISAIVALTMVLGLAGCEEEGTGEQIGAEIDRVAGDLQDRARDTADSVRDAASDAATDARNAVEDLCEDATDRDC